MAKRLTEEMVIARTKISDLSKIKRLNCWGSELVDVSLLRRMPSVEVLSLSINKINSLADFQFCKRLEELYIRQNDIRDLNEIVYLQNLTNLRNLWLGENPCANIDGYRLAVIKTLPQLQKLDNIQITQEELREAQRRGKTLIHPDDVQEYEQQYYEANYGGGGGGEVKEEEQNDDDEVEEKYIPSQHQQRQQQQYHKYEDCSESEYSPVQRSPPLRQQPEYEIEDNEDVYQRDEVPEGSKECSPIRQAGSPRRTSEIVTRRNYSPERQTNSDMGGRNNYEREPTKQSSQYYSRCPADNYEVNTSCDYNYKEIKIVNSQSANCIKDYANGDRYVQPQQQQYHHQSQQQQHYRQETNDQPYGYERRDRYACQAANHRPPFQRRLPTRNSNILSAILRLVKELDYPSLEVVEMEVRSRMDELVDE